MLLRNVLSQFFIVKCFKKSLIFLLLLLLLLVIIIIRTFNNLFINLDPGGSLGIGLGKTDSHKSEGIFVQCIIQGSPAANDGRLR